MTNPISKSLLNHMGQAPKNITVLNQFISQSIDRCPTLPGPDCNSRSLVEGENLASATSLSLIVNSNETYNLVEQYLSSLCY